MNVGIFYCGTNPDQLEMTRKCIASVREAMPDVEVHHLTDENTPEIEGVDSTRMFRGDHPLAVRRMLHNAACIGEWLFIDNDIIVREDVRDVFDDKDFDVALTNRDGTITYEGAYAAAMPYNLGVAFSRSQQFWMWVVQNMAGLPRRLQQWEGDQRFICAAMKENKVPFKVKVIPGLKYNYPPMAADDGRINEAAIIHFKGHRKKWLKEAA